MADDEIYKYINDYIDGLVILLLLYQRIQKNK